MTSNASLHERVQVVHALTQKEYDLLVIGGGIYGACMAWEASLRGLNVALVEAADFGAKTSSNSQKIIHGGLRYLQHLDIARIRESVRERKVLLRIAPHLVRPMSCLMPTYRGLTQPKWMMWVAGVLYDLFSWDRNWGTKDPERRIPATRIVNRRECLALAPDIEDTGVTGGIIWQDGQMKNSERLTLAFIQSAMSRGARVLNYAKVVGINAQQGRVSGVEVEDVLSGRVFNIRAKTICNAAGPWLETLLGSAVSGYKEKIRFSKAVNLVTRSVNDVVALGLPSRTPQSTGRRLFFITPWRGLSIIGTEFSVHDESPDQCRVTQEEIEQFLVELNAAYPQAQLKYEDVLYVQSGLLPVTDPQLKREFGQVDRHYHIWEHAAEGYAGLISVVGVKYTTARDVAEKVLNQITGRKSKRSRRIPVYGGEIEDLDRFMQQAVAQEPAFPEAIIRRLVAEYGTSYSEVLARVDQEDALLSGTTDVLKAEVLYAVNCEMAHKLSDVIFRRLGIGTLGQPADETLVECAEIMAAALNWDDEKREQEIQEVTELFEQLRGVGV